MKPGTTFKSACKALLGAGAMAAVIGLSGVATAVPASAQNIYETPQARGLGVPDFSSGPATTGNERRYRNTERRRDRAERRERRRDRVERRERRHDRIERRANRDFSYRKHRHGNRHRNRRHGYSHYYNGFWYSAPFWTYGYDDYAPSYSAGPSSWDLHVEWCHDRYRSYNEDRDAYKGYDGLWHRCISPYS